VSKKETTTEATSFGEDLEGREWVGRQSKPSEEEASRITESKRCCSRELQKRKRAGKLEARVCVQMRRGKSDGKIIALNKLVIIVVRLLTKGAQKQVPDLQTQRSWESFDFANTVFFVYCLIKVTFTARLVHPILNLPFHKYFSCVAIIVHTLIPVFGKCCTH